MQNTQDGRVQPSPIDAERVLRQTFVASVECHGTVDSTNDRAKQCWTEGREPLPLLVTAERQSAGRGRGTNRWWTGEGSLAFSLLLELRPWAIDRNGEPMTALVAGIATAEASGALLPQGTVGIHWPNDIFAAGRKVAGILTEAPRPGTHVIGIGINTNTSLVEAPVELQRKAATLLDLTGSRHDHTEILIRLLQNLEYLLDRLGRQPQAIAAHADSLCLQRGKSLTLDMGQELITGICCGVAADGGLLLETSQGRRVFYSGVVRRWPAAVGNGLCAVPRITTKAALHSSQHARASQRRRVPERHGGRSLQKSKGGFLGVELAATGFLAHRQVRFSSPRPSRLRSEP